MENKITDEDFIKMFGCDRETYDKKLCENEYRRLKERDNIAEREIMAEYSPDKNDKKKSNMLPKIYPRCNKKCCNFPCWIPMSITNIYQKCLNCGTQMCYD